MAYINSNTLFVIEGIRVANGASINYDNPTRNPSTPSSSQIINFIDANKLDSLIDEFTPGRHIPSIAFRSVVGKMYYKPISMIPEMVWHMEAINETELNKLLYNDLTTDTDATDMIGSKGGLYKIIEYTQSGLFYIRTRDINMAKKFGLKKITLSSETWYGNTFYYGDESSVKYIGQSGGLKYYTLEMHWICAGSTVINNIT